MALRKGQLRGPSETTVADAAEEWLELAASGVVRTRSGDRYKPSALRSYRQALHGRVLPAVGHLRLTAVTTKRLQDLADRMVAEGLSPSMVRNTLLPLRAIYRRALARDEVAVNPTLRLVLPAVRSRRERVARPEEARALVEALRLADRALWATALWAGLRRGELLALQWEDVDFGAGCLRVRRAWDWQAGLIEPKSRAGERRLPMVSVLRRFLLEHRLRSGSSGEGFVFAGKSRLRPVDYQSVLRRARAAWAEAGLEPIGLHECRHSYAAFMIAAGTNAKALSTYMGHSSITVTLDRYGHLLPGNEAEAVSRFDAWLERVLPALSPG